MDELVRFGTHAEIIRRNGLPWLIPATEKRPAAGVNDYPQYGFHPADKVERAWWLKHHALANIALVMSGAVVVIDVDILDEDLVDELLALALKMLGPIDWRRVGQAPKTALFYRALDQVPTFASTVVEIFCSPGSKLVLLFGRHPETGAEYDWPGPCSPLSHRLDQMPGVYASQVIAFREAALGIVKESGYVKPSKSQSSGSMSGPSDSVAGIGDMMSEIFRAVGVGGDDPIAAATSYFEQAPDGAKHYAMVAAVSVLVLRGYSDQQIVEALIDVYRRRVHDDPSLRNLFVCPKRVRRGLLRRGAVLPGDPMQTRFADEQRAAYERGRGMVRGIFRSKLSRNDVEIRAATVIERERDPVVRRALGNVVAAQLVRHGWPNATIASALSLASQRQIGRLPGWLDRFRSVAS